MTSAPAPRRLWCALSIALLVAGGLVAFDPGGWHAFGPVKWLVVTVAAWAGAAAAVTAGVRLHRVSTEGWALFLLWAAVTAVAGVDPLSAWLGTPDRRLGVVGVATMGAAYVTGQAVDDHSGRRLVARATVVALLAMSAYGAMEAGGVPLIQITTTTDRLGSTFGSPAYLGAALCLLIPIVLGVAVSTGATAWRVASLAAAAGGVFLLAGSGTRAALVGLVGAGAVALRPLWTGARRRPWLVAAVAMLVLLAVTFSPLGVRTIGADAEGRVAEWRTAVDAISRYPLLGVGLEGYRVIFPQHVGVEYVQDYGRTTVTDRAHSGPLDLALGTGVIGGLAWLAAAAFVIARAWTASRESDPLLTGLAAGVTGLLVQEMFLFPSLEVGVAGWAAAGMVVAATPSPSPLLVHGRAVAAAAALVAMGGLVVGVADVVADHRAAGAVASGDVGSALAATALRPDSFRYRLLAADISLRRSMAAEALVHLDEAQRLSPRDPALAVARARVLARLVADGEREAGPTATVVGELITADPNHPELRLIHGDLLAAAGEPAQAERAWLAAQHLSPQDPEPSIRLAVLYIDAGLPDLAREAVERLRRVDPLNPRLPPLEDAIDES